MARYFFGYASKPELTCETVRNGAAAIANTGQVETTTWEELNVDGRIIIARIQAAIEDCDVAAFDLSGLNQNVLFELGYAIARAKSV